MDIKNIEVFELSPITIKIGNEEHKIGKIPAIATLNLYKTKADDDNADSKINLLSYILSLGSLKKEDGQYDIAALSVILSEMFTKFDNEIKSILSSCLKKDLDWIETNIGMDDAICILSAIAARAADEMTLLLKKNEALKAKAETK